MSNEGITDEMIAELWRTFAGTNEVLRIERRNFKHVLDAILKEITLRLAVRPPKHKHWSAALADDMIASGDVPASQTWDVNQIAMACAQAEISDGHCQSLLIALEESNKGKP